MNAQLSIDGDFAFQSDSAKKYSLYIPSTYVEGTDHRLMLALHPWNTARWDSESWRDTLITFAEMTQLILVSPDGGADGQIDDPIDTAFTTALLDSVRNWYSVDTAKQYVMGFSWGGKTTYTYGMRRTSVFSGFMPIGAAINGTADFINFISNATGTPWYLIHGGNDAAPVRFTPALNALNGNGAVTNDTLLPGIGHTIDFPNRNQILADAFFWIDSVNCTAPQDTTDTNTTAIPSVSLEERFSISSQEGRILITNLDLSDSAIQFSIYSLEGKLMLNKSLAGSRSMLEINTAGIELGIYLIEVKAAEEPVWTKKILLR